MSSGEGNAGDRKTTIGLISEKATLDVQHTFFVHFFAIVLHDYNVKLPETSQLHVLWRKCRTFLRSLFFHYRSFLSCIGGRYHFSFCHRLPTKKNVSFVFSLSLLISVALFLVELRWPAAHFLFCLCFSCSIFQICGHDN